MKPTLTAEESALRHITGPCPACKQTMLLDDELDPDISYKRPGIGREFRCPWCGVVLAIRSIMIIAMRTPEPVPAWAADEPAESSTGEAEAAAIMLDARAADRQEAF